MHKKLVSNLKMVQYGHECRGNSLFQKNLGLHDHG